MFDIGKVYKLSNRFNKSSIERETMLDKIGNVIARNIVWNKAEFFVKPSNEREIQLLREAAFDCKELYVYDISGAELIFTWEGVDEWYDIVEGAMDLDELLEDYRRAIIFNPDEYGDFTDFLQRAYGFDWDEERVIIEGGIIVEEIVA